MEPLGPVNPPDVSRQYVGHGDLEHADGSKVPCAFRAYQTHEGSVKLVCQGARDDLSIADAWSDLTHPPDALRLTGNTDDTKTVTAQGPMFWTDRRLGSNGSTAVYWLTGPATLVIGRSCEPTQEFRFALTNAIFDVRGQVGSPHSETIVRFDDVAIVLRHAPGYHEVKGILRATDATRVTAHAIVPGRVGFDHARRLVGDLCDLLTLGLGTLVNWIHCDSCDTTGEVMSSYHYSAITRPFAESHPLVCRSIPGDLERFVEGCYPRFHELRDDRELHALTHAFAEARGRSFLDSRTLIAASLIDHVTGIDAARQGRTKITNEQAFHAALKVIERDLRTLLVQHLPNASPEEVEQMACHAQGLNWTTLRRRLKAMAERYNVPLSSDISRYLETRNSLAHELRFKTDDRYGEYRHVLSVLDRLLLGLLQYRGPYRDIRNGQRTLFPERPPTSEF